MDEAEQLCDRLVIMDEARIVDGGTPRELIERHATREVVEVRGLELDQVQGLGERIEPLADRLLLYTDHGDAVMAALRDRSLQPRSVFVRRSGLEDVFLHLTGRSLVD
jgi:lipooligosaccharide transport system ATP-binding protein